MTTFKKVLYSLVGLAGTTAGTFAAGATTDFGLNKVTGMTGSSANTDISTTIISLINNAMLYISLLALVYGIWAGFQMLTAGGDEEKVKKGRTIIIQVIIGIVVIVLAGSIVKFIVELAVSGSK
jgi:hypothetical protein